MGIVQPSTPANFRTDLASRTFSGPGIRRPTTGSPVATTHLPPQQQHQQHQQQTLSYTSTNDTEDFSIPHAQVTVDHLPTTTPSQHYYLGSQYPPSTPQKQVFTYVQQPPEFTFSRSGYSPQQTPIHTGRRRPPSIPIRPMTPHHPTGGQSGYFSSSSLGGEARPRPVVVGGGVGSAVVSASGGRAGSPVSRGGTGVGRGYERTGGSGGGDFVAGLTAHGGRR
jgi:hypothetical protein